MAERVRIVDLAEELGLSTATVSNVIHGKTKKISDETVKRVQALLEERQYVPSMAGILLARNDSRIVGVVVNNHEKYEGRVLEDAFVSSSLNALLFELERAGYFMMIKATQDWSEVERFASMWNMDGMVLLGFCDSDYEKLRARMHIPFVVYDGFFQADKGICNLTIDNFDGGRQVGAYLKEMGHRRAVLISDNDICMDAERMAGFREGFSDGETDFLEVPMNREGRRCSYRENIERIRACTAAFAVSDVYAAEFIHFLQEQGISVPGEISVVGFDDNALCENCFPRLTTVGQDAGERARMAVHALRRLWDGETDPIVEALPVKLIIRDSVKRKRY
ncbi:MAG: LacI family transcriptional regulator [Lachnospiraceae bacterium]|nr:LacI family transcriptional regulator [Lachnospiraceae bacterium]